MKFSVLLSSSSGLNYLEWFDISSTNEIGLWLFQCSMFMQSVHGAIGISCKSCWERTIRQILPRPCKLWSCFLVTLFVFEQLFCSFFFSKLGLLFRNKTGVVSNVSRLQIIIVPIKSKESIVSNGLFNLWRYSNLGFPIGWRHSSKMHFKKTKKHIIFKGIEHL